MTMALPFRQKAMVKIGKMQVPNLYSFCSLLMLLLWFSKFSLVLNNNIFSFSVVCFWDNSYSKNAKI